MSELSIATPVEPREVDTPAIGLAEGPRAELAALLDTLLADETVLYVKTRSCHWNVTGIHFHALHELFGDQYAELEQRIDDVAERIRALGDLPSGTLAAYCAATRIEDAPVPPTAHGMLTELVADHETVVRHLRADLDRADQLGDAGTSDFLTGLMEAHEKTAWMLRASATR